MTELVSVCRDEDCPRCGWPETYAEINPEAETPGAEAIGCRNCGWREAAGGEHHAHTLQALFEMIDQIPPGRTTTLHWAGRPEKRYVAMSAETWQRAERVMALGQIAKMVAGKPATTGAQVVVWGARDAPRDVLDEYAGLVGCPADQPVTLSDGHPGTEWQAEPVHFVIGRPHLVVATAQALDVDAVRLWVDGAPAEMEEIDGERAFAVVFAEVRPTLGKAVFPNGVPDLLGALEQSVDEARAARLARQKENPDG